MVINVLLEGEKRFMSEVGFSVQVQKKVMIPVKDFVPPIVSEDLNATIKSKKVQAPTHMVSTICDDRGTEVCIARCLEVV